MFDEATVKYPLSEEAQEVWFKQGDTRIHVSFYQRYGKTIQDLTKSSKILVFIDDELSGSVRFRRLRSEDYSRAGCTEIGVISAEVLDKEVEKEWCHWESFPIRWKAYSLIREKIFGECMKEVSYRERLKDVSKLV